MKVYVVMGNDYPESVYEDEAAAQKVCAERMRAQREASKTEHPQQFIYWRAYEFNLIRETAK